MSNYNQIKNRLNNPINIVEDLLSNSKIINIVINNEIYLLDYLYQDNNHYIFIPKQLSKNIINHGVITFDNSRGKIVKQIRFNFELDSVETLELNDPILKKKTSKRILIFKMININSKVILDSINQFYYDGNKLSFLKYDLYNKERFENSRLVCMSYLEREFILNVIVIDNTYYGLTKVNSNKIDYIKNNGLFKCFDGIDNNFMTNIEILDNSVDLIYNKLDETNNNYFKTKDDLVAIKFNK